jgi:glycosyl transferase family 25
MQQNFQYMNDYYDKIYVLSIPRLEDRIRHINSVLKGLDFEFFWGTDKQNVVPEKLEEQGLYSKEKYREFYKNPSEMSTGMLCCSLGHVKIYETIIRNKYQRTLILEDDVVPIDANINLFPQIVSELPSDWELLYLGYEKNEDFGWKQKIKQNLYKIFPSHAQLKMNRKLYSSYYPKTISAHIARAGFHDCTHAYSVTFEGAKKLLHKQQPVAFNADNLLAYMNCTDQVKGFISRPKLFNQLSAFNNELDSLTS